MKKFSFKKPNINKSSKKKTSTIDVLAIIVSSALCIALICVVIGLILMVSMLKDKPELDINDFTNEESSIIYDENGEIIAELGTTIRENVSYDELPNSLIDAFVAVEDSRYFSHNGFDLPRFTKAILSNLKSLSFSQGGSTFTMQLVKNTYFTNDETGEQASRTGLSGVTRKVQEIALAIELENNNEINKKTIFELYLNKLNFGGSRNIRGVQKAAQYYFGKDVTDLNIAESALLAGIINAPNAYNPFNNLELATQRRNEVLYLMNYHGYISDSEYELAKSIKVEDLLISDSSRESDGDAVSYQAYIDVVLSEVYEITGKDPYTTGMRIYTYMNQDIQSLMDSIQNGENTSITFPDDEFEIASICINNQTGAIVGVLGGRNYADGGSLLLNHATDQYKQPGSAIKPILDYVLAFENLGWATSHVLVDKPIVYPGTSVIIANSNNEYQGQVTLKDALGNSLNTPAIQTLQAVIDNKGSEYVVNYLQSMGFDMTLEDFDVQNAIGGNKLTVSCEQLAAAQGALLNYGQYSEPHTISRIEFLDGKTPITPVYTSTQTVSAEASYMIDTLLNSNVSGGYANLMQILIDDYPVYAKTGTTDWADAGLDYGIPTGSIKDAWMVGSSTEYTVATWIGYERAQKDKQSYITLNAYLSNIQGKTTNAILDESVEEYGTPAALSQPEGVATITHILATYPYADVIEGMDEQYITTGLIKKEYATLVNPETVEVSAMTSDPTISYDNGTLTIKWPAYPDETKLSVAEDTMDISLTKSDGTTIVEMTGKRLFDYSWVYGPIRYKADIKVNNTTVNTVSSETSTNSYSVTASPGSTVSACAYYAYENQNISSTQRCVSTTVEDKTIILTIPSVIDDIAVYLEGYGCTVVTEEKKATSDHSSGTVVISDGTKTYTQGAQYEFKQSELITKTITIAKYVETKTKVTLTNSTQSGWNVKQGNSIDVNSNCNVDWTVSYSNKDLQIETTKTDTKLSIKVTSGKGDIKVTATDLDDSSNESTITIKVE